MKNQRKMALLAAAMIEDFPDLVSGYVVDARIESLQLTGNVFKAFGYRNGACLVSTVITQIMHFSPDRWVIKTGGDDFFVIASFARGGRQSVENLAEKFEAARLSHSRWHVH
jgi:hypothetical protein